MFNAVVTCPSASSAGVFSECLEQEMPVQIHWKKDEISMESSKLDYISWIAIKSRKMEGSQRIGV